MVPAPPRVPNIAHWAWRDGDADWTLALSVAMAAVVQRPEALYLHTGPLAAGATALGLDVEVATALAAGAALASLGDEESNFSQLIRSVGKLARKTSKPVVESVSEKLEQIEREKPARDLFPSGEAGRVFRKPAPARKPAPKPTPAPKAAPFSFGGAKPAPKPTPAPAPAFGLFGGGNLGFNHGHYRRYNTSNQATSGIANDSGWRAEMGGTELPLSNLYLTMLHKLGVETDSFGGSTEPLSGV